MNQQSPNGAIPRKLHPPKLRLDCRRAYVQGEVSSVAELARLKGIPVQTARDWAQNEGWTALRQRWLDQQDRRLESPLASPSEPENAQQSQDYVSVRLARVRKQLDELDTLMTTEVDPQRLDRLASAQAKVSEQERILAGRPLPGSRRPGKERPAAEPEIQPI